MKERNKIKDFSRCILAVIIAVAVMATSVEMPVYASEDENGNIKEYKPALVKADEDDKNKISKSKVITKTESEDYLYTNNQGDTKQYIPEKIDEDTPLLLTNGNYRVSFAPVSEGENVKKSAFSGETDKVSIEKDTIVTSTEEEKEAKVNAVYSDEESNIDLLYQSM